MGLEITGKIVSVFQIVTGNGKKGIWTKQDFLLEIPSGQYTKNVCVSLWGEDKINKYDLVVGLTVTVHIELESREYNGRYYTDVKAWKVTWDAQQKRTWQPGGDGKKGAAASEEPIKANPQQEYDQEKLGTGPLDDSLPF